MHFYVAHHAWNLSIHSLFQTCFAINAQINFALQSQLLPLPLNSTALKIAGYTQTRVYLKHRKWQQKIRYCTHWPYADSLTAAVYWLFGSRGRLPPWLHWCDSGKHAPAELYILKWLILRRHYHTRSSSKMTWACIQECRLKTWEI